MVCVGIGWEIVGGERGKEGRMVKGPRLSLRSGRSMMSGDSRSKDEVEGEEEEERTVDAPVRALRAEESIREQEEGEARARDSNVNAA